MIYIILLIYNSATFLLCHIFQLFTIFSFLFFTLCHFINFSTYCYTFLQFSSTLFISLLRFHLPFTLYLNVTLFLSFIILYFVSFYSHALTINLSFSLNSMHIFSTKNVLSLSLLSLSLSLCVVIFLHYNKMHFQWWKNSLCGDFFTLQQNVFSVTKKFVIKSLVFHH